MVLAIYKREARKKGVWGGGKTQGGFEGGAVREERKIRLMQLRVGLGPGPLGL